MKKIIQQRFNQLGSILEKKKYHNHYCYPVIVQNLTSCIQKLREENKILYDQNLLLKEKMEMIEELSKKYPLFDSFLTKLINVFSSEMLIPNHFFFTLMSSALDNMTRSPNGFRYSDDIYKFSWYLKYIGGKRLVNLLRGVGNKFNIPIPSNRQLKQRKPTIIKQNHIETVDIPPGKYFIAFDEMDIRNGSLFF